MFLLLVDGTKVEAQQILLRVRFKRILVKFKQSEGDEMAKPISNVAFTKLTLHQNTIIWLAFGWGYYSIRLYGLTDRNRTWNVVRIHCTSDNTTYRPVARASKNACGS